ncbi:unnamed protein product [Clonostachys rosea]|uniref:Uncharacterized protein n=1 Tax=Bionectria ochroleuca TaxID=29856 RepID=A0ABY6TQC4_BIOOC|nr:unnamed protein product [Clonostachys rosea]
MRQKFETEPAGKSMGVYSQIVARLFISETNFAQLVSRQASPQEFPVCFTAFELVKAFTHFGRASSSEKDLAVSFITKLATDLSGAPIERLLDMWAPFLQDLIKPLRSNRIALDSDPCRTVYRTVFVRLVNEYIGEESSTGVIPSGIRVKCDCGTCRALNVFLADSKAKECGFTLGKRTRQHVKRKLEEAGVPCSCETVVEKSTPPVLVATKTSAQVETVLGIFNKFFLSDLKKLLGSDYTTIYNMKPVSETSDPLSESSGGFNAVGKDNALEVNLSSQDNDKTSSRKTSLRATSDACAGSRKRGRPKASGPTPENTTSPKRRAADDAPLASSGVAKKRKRGCAEHDNCVFAALFGPDVPH